MDITELSKQTNLASSKIRYYENMGLIKSSGRKGLKRTFHKDVIYVLGFIELSQSCGYSLKEIQSILKKNKKINLDNDSINLKLNDLSKQIKVLKRMQKTLEHLQQCPEEFHFDCPKFRKIIVK